MRGRRIYAQWRTYVRRIKKGCTRGKLLPYIYNNNVYLGKKLQKGSGAISKILSRLIPIVGPVVGELLGI